MSELAKSLKTSLVINGVVASSITVTNDTHDTKQTADKLRKASLRLLSGFSKSTDCPAAITFNEVNSISQALEHNINLYMTDIFSDDTTNINLKFPSADKAGLALGFKLTRIF